MHADILHEQIVMGRENYFNLKIREELRSVIDRSRLLQSLFSIHFLDHLGIAELGSMQYS